MIPCSEYRASITEQLHNSASPINPLTDPLHGGRGAVQAREIEVLHTPRAATFTARVLLGILTTALNAACARGQWPERRI